MDARIAANLKMVPAEREESFVKRLREVEKELLRAAAVAMVAAIWLVIPVGALSGMYYVTGSAVAPLILAGGFAILVTANYLLLSRMLVAWAELGSELSVGAVTEVAQRPAIARPAGKIRTEAEIYHTAA